ncbi:hypothetical protein KQY10_04630 [Leptospira interrogans]|uniref:Uncharacterized protein n=5 Tax=Leptospira interrogans TaxID=173 RepID=A0A0M4NZF1_LEPIR|nr:hypothetical protein [Leptospira interrogans]EMF72387.1 hypothetical protein LEP1GSC148_2502 [Leptospira interrogans serovar Canicola str. LT1962]ALE41137.1 hypothetical protein G436_3998 [Leptospira interrogans serovar Hardjo str. Norma]EKO97729.1 hypothetical protein LEP1GSC057_2657 [Leptospira interrogans str. Brem 329]EMM90586.1 hypothetical protein LEP1GSC145_3320 [Leptospira interrogans serovar Djasiman str. LT1649]MBM2888769.1 hypothetical protein [Leptospira interrogans]
MLTIPSLNLVKNMPIPTLRVEYPKNRDWQNLEIRKLQTVKQKFNPNKKKGLYLKKLRYV